MLGSSNKQQKALPYQNFCTTLEILITSSLRTLHIFKSNTGESQLIEMTFAALQAQALARKGRAHHTNHLSALRQVVTAKKTQHRCFNPKTLKMPY